MRKQWMGFLVFTVVVLMYAVEANAQESAALEAAKEAVAEPVAAPEAQAPASQPAAPAAVNPSPAPVEPLVLKQLRDHTPIPIRSSLDQANDLNGNRTLEYEEVKEYIKNVRSAISKNGKYPTNTDVLYHFDKNEDGFIDGGEIGALESYIH